MKEEIRKKIFSVLLAFILVFGVLEISSTVEAKATTKSCTDYWTCKLHDNKATDMYITLTAKFSSQKCTDVYFSRSHSHWPNAFSEGSTVKYKKSARGTYTAYSSLITQWASFAFDSYTSTIYIYK